MPSQTSALLKSLARSNELTITVTGRKSGRAISLPVWFVLEGNTLSLLPVQGSNTQWYKNVLKSRSIRIAARSAEESVPPVLITDEAQVKSVVEKFRAKYGAADVKKYYANFDVAVTANLE